MQLVPLYLFLGISHIALTGVRVLVSLYALHLGASAGTVGVIISLFAIVSMSLGISIGRLIDRFGVLPIILIGITSMTTGAALGFLLPCIATLFAVAVLTGTGHMMIQVSGQHAVGHLSTPETRAINYGHLASSYSVANFCGPMSAGFAIEAFGHGYTFAMFLGVTSLGIVLLAARTIRMPPPQHALAAPRSGSTFALLRDPGLKPLYVVGILQAAAWDIYTFILPIRGTQLGFSPSTIGIILGVFSVATLVIRVFMPWLLRRWHEWKVLQGVLFYAMLAYILMPLIDQAWMYMLMSVMLGLAVGAGQPNILALMHAAAPPGRGGEALGLRVACANTGQVLLPIGFGAASGALGVAPLFWLFATILAFGTRTAKRRAARQPGRSA